MVAEEELRECLEEGAEAVAVMGAVTVERRRRGVMPSDGEEEGEGEGEEGVAEAVA